jgi:hypothetical protein
MSAPVEPSSRRLVDAGRWAILLAQALEQLWKRLYVASALPYLQALRTPGRLSVDTGAPL